MKILKINEIAYKIPEGMEPEALIKELKGIKKPNVIHLEKLSGEIQELDDNTINTAFNKGRIDIR